MPVITVLIRENPHSYCEECDMCLYARSEGDYDLFDCVECDKTCCKFCACDYQGIWYYNNYCQPLCIDCYRKEYPNADIPE